MQELSEKVKCYHETCEVQDTKEWDSVIAELKAFSVINCAVRIASEDGKSINYTHRCTKVCKANLCLTTKHDTQKLDESQRTLANSDLRLKEALVIGNYAGQVHTDASNVLYALYLGKIPSI